MVKFAIASAFLIIASLSTSVSATFALSNITIFPTGYSVLSDGTENPGDNVSTVPASQGTPNTTTLTIFPFTDQPMGIYSVRGKAGWYIAVKEDATGIHLTWNDTVSYSWLITSNDPNSAVGDYNNYMINVPGQDLFWYSGNNTGNNIYLQNKTAASERFQIQTVNLD